MGGDGNNSFFIRTPPEVQAQAAEPRVRPADDQTHESPEAKRRKIRKGTRSCWECKRRKIRCNFASASDAVCIGCQRRGTHCLSQEYPEEDSRPAERGQQIGDRIVRVEALVEQLVRKVGSAPASSDSLSTSPINTLTPSSRGTPAERDDTITASNPGLPTPTPSDAESTQLMSLCSVSGTDHQHESLCPILSTLALPGNADPRRPTGSGLTPKLQKLSAQLYDALPSPEITRYICDSVGGFSLYFHQMLTRSFSHIDVEHATAEQCARLPPRDAHPVLIARYMLTLADFLQYLPQDPAVFQRLGESPRTFMKRLADTAISLVNTNEELMGTVESLQCIILEGCYQTNNGNLRRAWLAFRRAMVVGQLMGIHRKHVPNVKRLDPNTQADPQFIWYRIQFADRYLCLMLGLPAGSLDNNFASEAAMVNEPPMGKLERKIAVIASRILERNESPGDHCPIAETMEIDMELQQAAKLMPSKWWLPPNMSLISQSHDQAEIFWGTLRLIDQIFYYNLLNQLHLPYMLLFSADKQYVYSKIACINASREVLTRFIAFRSWNKVAFCCRSVDFFALMAAMTLVLAHLNAHGENDLNCLAHQRHTDRAMMEQVLESMEQVYRLNMDVLSEKSGDLLRRLLEIEADAADGKRYNASNVFDDMAGAAAARGESSQVPCPGSGAAGGLHEHHASPDDEPGVLKMCIPYFGVIRIAREGGISREALGSPLSGGAALPMGILGVGDSLPSSSAETSGDNGGTGGGFQQQGAAGDLSSVQPTHHHLEHMLHDHPHHEFNSELGNMVDDALRQEYPYPGLAASADDWAFQGVDMAFFDSLMKGMGNHSVQPPGQSDNGGPIPFGNNNDWATLDGQQYDLARRAVPSSIGGQ